MFCPPHSHNIPPYRMELLPASMSSSNLAIHVTLTSTRDRSDTRTLTLTHNSPCFIGRASKTTEKNLQPTSANALFDCPVVSRQHAELRAHPWSPVGEQVTITDHGSMHGTRVNGQHLLKGRSMALRSGDVIQLGDRVTRGEGIEESNKHMLKKRERADQYETDTHEGVRLEYSRIISQDSHTMAPSQSVGSRGYRGQMPYLSDGEESEGPHPDDISLICDEVDDPPQSSSTNTTPEQPNCIIGSQANPIELVSVRQSVIHLDQDDDSSPTPKSVSASAPVYRYGIPVVAGDKTSQLHIFDSNKIIQDSVDKHNSLYEPYRPHILGDIARSSVVTTGNGNRDSLFQRMSTIASPSVSSEAADSTRVLDEEDDDMAVELRSYDDYDEEDEDEAVHEEEDEDEDDNEEDGNVAADADADADNESTYDPDSFQPNEEPSPELGSDTDFVGTSGSAPPKASYMDGHRLNLLSEVGQSASQPLPSRYLQMSPRYAPPMPAGWRDNEPPQSRDYNSGHPGGWVDNGPWATSVHPEFSTSVNRGPPPGNDFTRPSRWDHGSPYRPPFYPHQSTSHYTAPLPPLPRSYGLSSPMNHNFNGRYAFLPPPGPGFLPPPPGMLNQSPQNEGLRSPKLSYAYMHARSKFGDEQPTEEQKLKDTGSQKISIGKLVEGDDTEELPGFSVISSGAGTKRKADEISNTNAIPTGLDVNGGELAGIADAYTPEEDEASVEPKSQRRRISIEGDVTAAITVEPTKVSGTAIIAQPAGTGMRDAARLAGSAVLGSVATVAFLCSPLAEMALEWLA